MKFAQTASLVFAVLLAIAAFPVTAQATGGTEVGAPDPSAIGVDTARQELKEISIDKFESAGFWTATMSTDEGIATARLFNGTPAGKTPIEAEKDLKIPDTQVLGVRIDFLRRGYNEFKIVAAKPLAVEGITKMLSVWVVGRNTNHMLKVIIADTFGREFELPLGTLNFQGWKKMTVAIPPQSSDGMTGIVQRNVHYKNLTGLRVVGFKVYTDPLEAFGVYYIYFDDLRATTDLFAENNRDPDDMPDSW